MKIKYDIKEQPEFITTENIHLLKVGMKVRIISGSNIDRMNGLVERVVKIVMEGSLGPQIWIGKEDTPNKFAICYNDPLNKEILVKLQIIK